VTVQAGVMESGGGSGVYWWGGCDKGPCLFGCCLWGTNEVDDIIGVIMCEMIWQGSGLKHEVDRV
jgi:hypothetical protein